MRSRNDPFVRVLDPALPTADGALVDTQPLGKLLEHDRALCLDGCEQGNVPGIEIHACIFIPIRQYINDMTKQREYL